MVHPHVKSKGGVGFFARYSCFSQVLLIYFFCKAECSFKTVGLLYGYWRNSLFHSVQQLFPFYINMHLKIKYMSILYILKCLNSLLTKTVSSGFFTHSEMKPRLQDESPSLGPGSVREGSLGFLLFNEFSLSLRDPCFHLLLQLDLETLVTAEMDSLALWPCPFC